ncbi:PfkB family carbohydrate kinase [Acidithiobacillus sp.]
MAGYCEDIVLISVFGSAHIDIIGHFLDESSVIDHVGVVDFRVGGTAYNVAAACRRAGRETRLITALPRSALAQFVQAEIAESGMEVRMVETGGHMVGAFSGHVGRDGKLVSAVSFTPIETISFDPEWLSQAISASRLMIADCNLSIDALCLGAQTAQRSGIPYWLAGVSEIKAERAVRAIERGYHVDLLQVNTVECKHLCNTVHAENAAAIARQWRVTLVVTNGKHGATLYTDEGLSTVFTPRQHDIVSAEADATCAGDVLLGQMAASWIRTGDITKSVEAASIIVGEFIRSRTSSTGDGHDHKDLYQSLDRHLQTVADHASRDSMTGLYNRRQAEAAMKQLPPWEPCALVLIDIDQFKHINDTYGHVQGDTIIHEVASILQSCVRNNDIAARWGGDEFLLLLRNISHNDAEMVILRIMAAIQSSSSPIAFSCSVGAQLFSIAEMTTNEAFIAADGALYEVKNHGRNGYRIETHGHQ